MRTEDVSAELAKPISRELLSSSVPARLAYTGRDGGPRVIPVGFWWDGAQVLVFTVPSSAKVPALNRDPRVAITIDTQGFPPRVLLVRGTAELTEVEGVPDEYVAASKKLMPPEQFDGWLAGVRALYERMTRIAITPTWAKLLDFETTIPKAVEDLIRARQT